MKNVTLKIKDQSHPAFGSSYLATVKICFGKKYWSCNGTSGPFFKTPSEARVFCERDAEGMAYTNPSGEIVTVANRVA